MKNGTKKVLEDYRKSPCTISYYLYLLVVCLYFQEQEPLVWISSLCVIYIDILFILNTEKIDDDEKKNI